MKSYRGALLEDDRILFDAVSACVTKRVATKGHRITVIIPLDRVSELRCVNRLDLVGWVGDMDLECIDSDEETGHAVGTFVTDDKVPGRATGQ